MGYDIESALISKVLETGDIKEAIQRKVTSNTFIDDENNRLIWEWVMSRYDRHGKVPSITLLQNKFPDFTPEDTDDSLVEIIGSVKEKRLYADLQVAIKEIAIEAKGGDPSEALEILKSKAAELTVSYSDGNAIDVTKDGKEILRQYQVFKKKKGKLGMPWPWRRMNKATKGLRNGSLNVMYGPPGTLKTWLLIFIADFVHQFGGRPVLFTFEMPRADIRTRWAALRLGCDWDAYQSGRLTAKEEARLNELIEEFDEEPPFIVDEIESVGQAALLELKSKIKEHNANIAFIDGLAFLADDEEWTSWGPLIKGLKKMALSLLIPVVCSHHTNLNAKTKGKVTVDQGETGDVAYGGAVFRYSDTLTRVARPPIHRENGEVKLVARKVREGLECALVVNAIPAVSFAQKYVIQEEEQDDSRKGKGSDSDGILGKD